MFTKDKISVLLAEFFGTFVLASAVIGSVTKINIPIFAAMTAGITLALMVLVIGKISGAHINPAVTFGLWSIRKVPTSRAIVFIATQLVAGICAFRLNGYFLGEMLPNIAGKNFEWKVIIAEALGTLIFTFGIAAAISQKLEDGRLAAAIGASLFVGIIVASVASNGVLNPAVAFGLHSYSINYAVGPLVGGLLGMKIYEYLFAHSLVKVSAKSSSKKKK